MARFGSEVTVFGRCGRILEKEDTDAADILCKQLEGEGVKMLLSCQLKRVARGAGGEMQVHISSVGQVSPMRPHTLRALPPTLHHDCRCLPQHAAARQGAEQRPRRVRCWL